MSKSVWGWIALILSIAGVYTLIDGLTESAMITASGNQVADGAVVLALAAGAVARWWTASPKSGWGER